MSDSFIDRLRDEFTDETAVREAIAAYFVSEGEATFTGSQFEVLADSAHPNEITAADIVAVSTLSVDVPARVSRWILCDEGAAEVSALLSRVPDDVDIWDQRAPALLAKDGPLWDLWDLLKTASWPERMPANGMGPTRLSKLLAAKRPRLVPVWDSVVGAVLGPVDTFWDDMRAALADAELRSKVARLTAGAPEHVSLLRRIDAVVWSRNRSARETAAD